jgi:MFS family permease
VDQEDLAWANGLVGLGRNAGIVVGPLFGGLVVSGIGAGYVFALNGVTFLASAALVATVHGRFNEDRRGGEDHAEHRGLRAGFRFLWRDRVLRTLTLSYLAIVLGLGMTMVADVPLVALFDAGSLGYGILIACWGGGSIVGSLLGRYLNAKTEPAALVAGIAVVSAMSILTGLSPWFALVLGAILVMGVGDGVGMVAEQGIMQRRTPDAVRSRVSGAFDAFILIGMATSYVMAGPMVAWLGPKGVYIFGGVVAFVGVALAVPILGMARTWAIQGERVGVPADVAEPASLLIP